ncbi:hypothetical protein U8V72_00010 [Priestia filamentosa]
MSVKRKDIAGTSLVDNLLVGLDDAAKMSTGMLTGVVACELRRKPN